MPYRTTEPCSDRKAHSAHEYLGGERWCEGVSGPPVRVVEAASIARCPRQSLLPQHYRDDGTCRCAPTCSEVLHLMTQLKNTQAQLTQLRIELSAMLAHMRRP